MTENIRKMEEYILEQSPTDPESHVLTFCYVQVMYQATQKQYANIIGISDRALRNYISNNQELYDEEKKRLQEIKEADSPSPDFTLMANRTITEEQLDKFVDALFKSAINGNARDKALFIEFTGLTSEQVLTLQHTKAKSLRYWIKDMIQPISQYMDTKSLGMMIETSPYIFRGTKSSNKNAQRFVDTDISDESFKLELMYWGAAFLSMMNNEEHPDLELLATTVRLDRLSKDIPEAYNKYEVRRYAEADFTPKKPNKTFDELMLELFIEIDGAIKGKEEFEKWKIEHPPKAPKAVKPPELDKAEVELRASEYEDELEILLTVEDEILHDLKMITKKVEAEKKANKN
ncbi:hypothetical protein [Robertmurraya korlensis]|uniref:hypothetical protein n=1 Tax=Robertmurraya korlensis TaxID=519977 RepID=UPI0008259BD7|nr:hypothetical protein [Robertmurraya korlensis]